MHYSILLFSAVFCFVLISSIVFKFSQFYCIQFYCFVFLHLCCSVFLLHFVLLNIMLLKLCSALFLICSVPFFLSNSVLFLFNSVFNIFYSCFVFLFYSVYLLMWSFIFSSVFIYSNCFCSAVLNCCSVLLYSIPFCSIFYDIIFYSTQS